MAAASHKREYLSLAIAVTVLVAAVWLTRTYAEPLKGFIDRRPVSGVILYTVVNVLDAVMAPGATLPLIPIAVDAWGHVATALLTTAGWTAGSLIAFFIASNWGVPLVKKLTSMERVNRIRAYVPRRPFWTVVVLRAVMPMDVLSYVLGLFTDMTLGSYALATALGLTPSAFILAYLGRTSRTFDIAMMGIGAVVVGLMIYSTRRGARKPMIAAFVSKRQTRRSRSRRRA